MTKKTSIKTMPQHKMPGGHMMPNSQMGTMMGTTKKGTNKKK